jgi:hypothetical protein
MQGEAKQLGFALWLEESKTSHFLQMPDRITRQCHAVYNQAKRRGDRVRGYRPNE